MPDVLSVELPIVYYVQVVKIVLILSGCRAAKKKSNFML